MPFNPSLPADHSPLSSSEMRSQMTALNTDIQTRVTQAALNTAMNSAISSAVAATLPSTSSNSNGVAILGQSAQGSYDQGQMQQVLDKIDELINTLRR